MYFIMAAIGKPDAPVAPATLEAYYELLKDLPVDAIAFAVRQIMAREEYPVLPTAGKIRNATIKLLSERSLSLSEAWGIITKAIKNYGHCREQEALESMPEPVAQVARWMGWREICLTDNIDVIRGQFLRMYKDHMAEVCEREQSRYLHQPALPADRKLSLVIDPRMNPWACGIPRRPGYDQP